jgi:hypothetical protein
VAKSATFPILNQLRGVSTQNATTCSMLMQKQWENRGNRDVCVNKVRLLVMQMVRKVLTFNVYNKIFPGNKQGQTVPPQCLGNDKNEFCLS